MRSALRLLLGTVGLVVGPVETLRAMPPTAPGEVVIRLPASATVRDPHVRVRDVATVEGGPEELRARIGNLDLANLDGLPPPQRISREQVYYRILLSGPDAASFRVEGAAQVQLNLIRRQVTEEGVIAAARKALLARLPWPAGDVVVRLAQPIRVPPLTEEEDGAFALEAELPASSNLAGKVRVEVAVYANGVRKASLPVYLEVKLYQPVAVATRRIEAGDRCTEENLHRDRRAVDGANRYVSYQDVVGGRRARRVLLPGQVVTLADVVPAAEENPVLIKQRDRVKLVARVGAMRVVTGGEALQDGRNGQVIQVRNTESKRVVIGRVINASMVEVDY